MRWPDTDRVPGRPDCVYVQARGANQHGGGRLTRSRRRDHSFSYVWNRPNHRTSGGPATQPRLIVESSAESARRHPRFHPAKQTQVRAARPDSPARRLRAEWFFGGSNPVDIRCHRPAADPQFVAHGLPAAACGAGHFAAFRLRRGTVPACWSRFFASATSAGSLVGSWSTSSPLKAARRRERRRAVERANATSIAD